jgi:hypothetical protein
VSLQRFRYELICMGCQTSQGQGEISFDATARFGLDPDDGPATLSAEQVLALVPDPRCRTCGPLVLDPALLPREPGEDANAKARHRAADRKVSTVRGRPGNL